MLHSAASSFKRVARLSLHGAANFFLQEVGRPNPAVIFQDHFTSTSAERQTVLGKYLEFRDQFQAPWLFVKGADFHSERGEIGRN